MSRINTAIPTTIHLARVRERGLDCDSSWRAAALAMLSVRFIQGFVYWGGGSRRFIYAPSKLDPHSATWMANKFQSAMPGALLGMDQVIAFMLHHFWILYPAMIFFSAAELVAGLFLVLGLFTRAAALVSVGFSIVLMLMFGWQGATCVDEWTMAACNLAMGATIVLAGSGAFSLDTALLARRPALAGRAWFRWVAGALPLPLAPARFGQLALVVLAATATFNVATYDHFRGSVYSAFHKGPVSPSKHHFTLSDASVAPDGSVSFHVYLDGGTADVPAYVPLIELRDGNGGTVARWDTASLARLPPTSIQNDFDYNRFRSVRFGLSAEDGAMATVTLPAPADLAGRTPAALVLTSVEDTSFVTAIKRSNISSDSDKSAR